MKNKGLILALSLILIIFDSLAQIKHNKAGLQLYYSFEELPKDKSGKKHKGKIHGKINLKSEIWNLELLVKPGTSTNSHF